MLLLSIKSVSVWCTNILEDWSSLSLGWKRLEEALLVGMN